MATAKVAAGSRKPNPNRGSKPGERRGGRQKGVPNKLSGDVKAMILAALDEAGGIDYLLEQSKNNPSAFMTLLGKVLPMTVAGDKDNPLQTVVKFTLAPLE
ncbi:MAG TPA: hypothetical protein VIT62_08905 [Lysobacter sp.]